MADAETSGNGGKAKTIYVKANEPINEDGFHAKGEIFEVEAKRAKALGKLVTEVNAKLVDGKLVEIAG